jgi:hypothetical protein
VYFRGERLAKASGHSIQQAEMNAAKEALELSQGMCTGTENSLKIWYPDKYFGQCKTLIYTSWYFSPPVSSTHC